MPQAPRKDINAQKAQDKESKRARGALSCAECRRLKLKCDKTVPCSSCKRRGCSEICPNGSLITGQGTRFVLADTEKLHTKISTMSDRIRHLEDALAVSHSMTAKDTHPLLNRELLKIKSSLELHAAVEGEDKEPVQTMQDESEDGNVIDAFGTLAIREDGAATFYGRSAGSESLLIRDHATPTPSPQSGTPGPSFLGQRYTSPEVLALASNFPLASNMYRPGLDVDEVADNYLPSWEEAQRLCRLYLEQAPWFFGAVTRRQIEEEILPMWYKEAASMTTSPAPMKASSPSGSDVSEPSTRGNAHDLALLFVIFCFGSMTDMEMPPAPNNPEAEQYHQLTKACLTIEPVLERPPGVSTVQTLALMAIYEGICSGDNSIESTWGLFGLASKLAQSIGLHRDPARFKLSPAEVQKRRALFWELFITDCWQALATGRLPTFSLPFVDCELPADPDETLADDGTRQSSFPFWKARFGAECVSAVVQGALTSRAPKYSIILELDRKVRDMDFPLYAQGPPPQGLGLAQTMSHYMPTNYRELTLLYIHRCFFVHAVSNSSDPLKSPYAPSFLAGYRSACEIIRAVNQQFTLFPAQIARFWVLWTHAFSAAFMISSVVTHNPKCKVAPAALLEMKTACDLFEKAASFGGRAVKFLPSVKRWQAGAQKSFRDASAGIPPRIANDIFRPSNLKEEENDELLIFGGKTHTVTTKSGGPSKSSSNSPQNTNVANSREPSGSPSQMFAENPSFANAHPSLVNELTMFDGHIRAQAQNAYRQGGDVFGSGEMAVDPEIRVTPPSDGMLVQQQVLHPEQHEHQQQFLQQIEHQRRELQQLEMERQQQQEAARQQQLLQEQEQQEEIRRQQLEQQRVEQYRYQMEQQQQRQMQDRRRQQQAAQQYQQPTVPSNDYSQYSPSADPYAPQSSGAPTHSLHRIPNRSMSSLHQTLEQHEMAQPSHQPQYAPSQRHHQQASTSAASSSAHHQQQYHPQPPAAQMYPDYGGPSSSSSQYASPVPANTSYEHHHHTSISVSPQAHSASSVPQTPVGTENYHQYWTAAPTNAGPSTGQQRYGAMHPGQHHQQPQQYYTPETVLRGYAVEDAPMQKTWQEFMGNLGSPRF